MLALLVELLVLLPQLIDLAGELIDSLAAFTQQQLKAWPDLQIQTSAIVIKSDIGESADFLFGELLNQASH
jgi:hypothetical protein